MRRCTLAALVSDPSFPVAHFQRPKLLDSIRNVTITLCYALGYNHNILLADRTKGPALCYSVASVCRLST